jgi:hypothetical protein
VNEPPQSEATRPSVLAIGVTPLQAMQAYHALLEVAPQADLRAPEDPATRDRFSGHADRVRFVALDPLDPIESQLLVSYSTYSNEVSELLTRSPETSRFIDPFSVVIVTTTTEHLAAADPDGGDPPSLVSRAVRTLQRSLPRRHEASSALARLLGGLGHSYGGGFPGPVLVEVEDAATTLVAEPGLPPEAVRLAERLVMIRGQDTSHVPLRWNAELQQWAPLGESWSEQAALRKLATEIQVKLPPAR